MTPNSRWAAAVAAVCLLLPTSPRDGAFAGPPPPPPVVVAVIDTGVNPYHPAFRDRSALAYRHPSTYLPGFPKDAPALRLTLDRPYDAAVARDQPVWDSVDNGELYWIPGTRIVGAIRLASGGSSCPVVSVPPASILNGPCAERPLLDDVGHGTMTASRAAGVGTSVAPAGARLVVVEGIGGAGTRWAADQGWIDVQTNSWLSLVPQPVDGATVGITRIFAAAATRTLTFAASGNGAAYLGGVAPTSTYTLSTGAPGVVLVGGHDNGRVTAWAGTPAHVVADAYAGRTAMSRSDETRADPVACCTSAASPYAAGGAAAVLAEARRLLGDRRTGVRAGGVVARGRAGAVRSGPLADGLFTLDEWRQLVFHTAEARPAPGRDDGLLHWAAEPRAPDYPQFGPGANPYCQGCTTSAAAYASLPAGVDLFDLVGYGAVNERSVALAVLVLRGRAAAPARPAEDAKYARDQELRRTLLR